MLIIDYIALFGDSRWLLGGLGGVFERSPRGLGEVLGGLGGVLGAFVAVLGELRGILGRCLGVLGGVSGGSWRVSTDLEPCWAPGASTEGPPEPHLGAQVGASGRSDM